jgi:hypothetical protein
MKRRQPAYTGATSVRRNPLKSLVGLARSLISPPPMASSACLDQSGDKCRTHTMMAAEAEKILEGIRAFVGTIYADRVVLDGPFKRQELEAILVLMRDRPAETT